MTYVNICNQECTAEYRHINNGFKPYEKILFMPSGIYAAYGTLLCHKDKLQVKEILLESDDTEMELRPILFQLLCSSYDVYPDATFRIVCADGLDILVRSKDKYVIKEILRTSEKLREQNLGTYNSWLKAAKHTR